MSKQKPFKETEEGKCKKQEYKNQFPRLSTDPIGLLAFLEEDNPRDPPSGDQLNLLNIDLNNKKTKKYGPTLIFLSLR